MIHTVKGFGIVNKAEIDVFLGLSCFFDDPAAVGAAKSLQSCRTLCNPVDSSPPGSPVPEILQARTVEWVAISFSLIKAMPNNVQSTAQLHSSHTLVNYHTIALISHASKVMLKILQARPSCP